MSDAYTRDLIEAFRIVAALPASVRSRDRRLFGLVAALGGPERASAVMTAAAEQAQHDLWQLRQWRRRWASRTAKARARVRRSA